MKYLEILKKNKEFQKNKNHLKHEIALLSNITLNPFKDILEYYLRIEGISPNINVGDYDNIVQDSLKYRNSNTVIIFWELVNITNDLYKEIDFYSKEKFNQLIEKTKLELDLVFKNLKQTQLVLFNKFSTSHFSFYNLNKSLLDELNIILNQYLIENIPDNFKLVEIEKTFLKTGIKNSIEIRNFYLTKALYSVDFYKSYSIQVRPYILSLIGKSKKVLIFDCDNTLWGGILGEDGFENIEMSSNSIKGKIFNEVQKIALNLNKKGVILGLCSKNNMEDVDEVINSHPDMIIKNQNLSIKKINWNNKASNLKEIADKLNVGLDSIVFVDDSLFEINLIRSSLPEVTTIKVPEAIHDYPNMLRENIDLFYNLYNTKEDLEKTKMYNQENERRKIKNRFKNIEDYISSLELKITITENDDLNTSRLSQLTQKTNQFNLTTKRYSVADFDTFLNDPEKVIYSVSVVDKYGSYGITGLVILVLKNNKAIIDTFLMSCRILGRNIEFVMMNFIISKLKTKNITTINAEYIKNKKNHHVEPFYKNCSFEIQNRSENIINHNLSVINYKKSKINYIQIEEYGK